MPALAMVVPVPCGTVRAGEKVIPLPAPRMAVPTAWAERRVAERMVMPVPGEATRVLSAS